MILQQTRVPRMGISRYDLKSHVGGFSRRIRMAQKLAQGVWDISWDGRGEK